MKWVTTLIAAIEELERSYAEEHNLRLEQVYVKRMLYDEGRIFLEIDTRDYEPEIETFSVEMRLN